MLVHCGILQLCTFFLAQIEQPKWRYKDALKKPLNTLKDKGKLLFDDVKNCFTKEEGQTFLEVDYIPRKTQLSVAQNTSQTNIIDCIEENQGLLDKLLEIKIHPENAKDFVEKYSKEDIEQALEIVKNRKSSEPIANPSAFFKKLLERPEKRYSPVKQKQEDLKKKDFEKQRQKEIELRNSDRKKQEAIETYQKMTNDERWKQIYQEVLSNHVDFQKLSPEQQKSVKENVFQNVLPKSKSMGVAMGYVRTVIHGMV